MYMQSLKESMNEAAKIYGVEKTFYLTNGSTQGILTAILSFLKYNDSLVVTKNCHQSVYDAIKLATVQKPGYDNKPFVLEQKHIDRQKTIDRICFESLKNMGLEYYKFALTDRSFFKTVRGKMLKNKNFLNDFATLRADSVMKFDKAVLLKYRY